MKKTQDSDNGLNGLNRAQRLNVLNACESFRFLVSEYDYRSNLHEIAPRLRYTTLGFSRHLACACFTAELPKKLAQFHHAGGGYGIPNSKEAA